MARETVNKYSGTCIRCDNIVPAGEGYMRTDKKRGYLPIHKNCAEKEAQERKDRKQGQGRLF